MSRTDKRLAEARRQAARRAKIQPYNPATFRLTARQSERAAITASHSDLLLAIESTIVAVGQQSVDLDDRMVRDALECCIRGSSSQDEEVNLLSKALVMMRNHRFQVSDETWRSALRVIRTSVCTISDCEPGYGDYLLHAEQFVRAAHDE